MRPLGNKNPANMDFARKKVFWLSSLVFGLSNTIYEVQMANRLSRDARRVYFFGMVPTRGYEVKEEFQFIAPWPTNFVPLVTPFFYTLYLILIIPIFTIAKKPDYIITDSGTSIVGFALKFFLPRIKAKIVLDVRSTPIMVMTTRLYVLRSKINAIMFAISIKLAKKFDGMTVVTEHMKTQICQQFKINPELVRASYNGVNTMLFNPNNFDRMRLRKNLGLENKFVLFYHGAVAPTRGIDQAVQSFLKLGNKFSDLVFFVLGSGEPNYERKLRHRIETNGSQDRIILHKQVPYRKVPEYIAIADVGLVPLPNLLQWRYQLPQKLLEYLAMGKVTVATDIPANRMVIGDRKCGIFAPSAEPQHLAKAIAFAYHNRKKLEEWGATGRKLIKEKYDWEKMKVNFEYYLSSL